MLKFFKKTMGISFFKFEGAGNDFIMVDNREGAFGSTEVEKIKRLCDRNFGIGADGLILLENVSDSGLRMIYFNADGRESSMCGNGGRCFAAFANVLGLAEPGVPLRFVAVDGEHAAEIVSSRENIWDIVLSMKDVKSFEEEDNIMILNTGSPHYVRFVEGPDEVDFLSFAKSVRYSPRFEKEGINVNIFYPSQNGFGIRTYERGVEGETLACGTGVVAAAISANVLKSSNSPVQFQAKGGVLSVQFEKSENGEFEHIRLRGPARMIFRGEIF